MQKQFLKKGSNRPMDSSTKTSNSRENLYEIPACSICLQDLSSDILSLPCGHCYHDGCIRQQLEYHLRCPNCMNGCGQLELRKIHYSVVLNCKDHNFLTNFLASLERESKQQVQSLLGEIVRTNDVQEKMKGQIQQYLSLLKKNRQTLQQLSQQCTKQSKSIQTLTKQNKTLDNDLERAVSSLRVLQRSEAKLRIDIEKYHKLDKKYEQLRKYQKVMTEHSSDLRRYKIQLESEGTRPEQIVKVFYDMLMLYNLKWKKLKEESQSYPDKLIYKENEISKLQEKIAVLNGELNQNKEKRAAERRKYEELKNKFRSLSEKAKLKGVSQIPDLEDSQGFMNAFKSQGSRAKDEKDLLELDLKRLKKPAFGSFSTIGGLKKKEEKPRLYI